VAECFHKLSVKAGDAMFLPSGRVHSIGAGLVIFEIQQNSDTTYRVFDWNRVGLDGKPRNLHANESLASIDFNDFEPQLIHAEFQSDGALKCRPLANALLFLVDAYKPTAAANLPLAAGKMQIIAVVLGSLEMSHRKEPVRVSPGQFCLVPACILEPV